MNIAIDVEEVSPEWLTFALGYPVRAVTSKRIGTGQTGTTCRITVDADQGPKSFILKCAAGEMTSRQRVSGAYRREVGFYSKLADTVTVRVPHCSYAAIADDCQKYTLLLEDLAPRVPGVQTDGCSIERAQGAVRNLVGLHAPRWNDSALFEHAFLTRSCDEKRAKFLSDITIATTAKFVERYAEELGPDDVQTMLASADALAAWAIALSAPFSVTHGDYRLDNLMFGADPADVVALDWQTAEIGPPTRDLSYFIAISLSEEDRRRHERDLVRLYCDELLSRGVKNYDFEQCFNGYRLGHLQGTMTVSIGCMYATGERSAQSDAMFISMAKRSCAAIRDLGTLDLLKTLA